MKAMEKCPKCGYPYPMRKGDLIEGDHDHDLESEVFCPSCEWSGHVFFDMEFKGYSNADYTDVA